MNVDRRSDIKICRSHNLQVKLILRLELQPVYVQSLEYREAIQRRCTRWRLNLCVKAADRRLSSALLLQKHASLTVRTQSDRFDGEIRWPEGTIGQLLL